MRRISGSIPLTLIVCVAILCVGAVGGLALGGVFDDDDERTITPIAVGTNASDTSASARPDIVVDDGIPTGDARRAAQSAANRFDGAALTVDRDDGRYEIDLQRPDGTIVQVLVDERFRALGIEGDS